MGTIGQLLRLLKHTQHTCILVLQDCICDLVLVHDLVHGFCSKFYSMYKKRSLAHTLVLCNRLVNFINASEKL